MKRILPVLLSLALLLAMTACGGTPAPETPAAPPPEEEIPQEPAFDIKPAIEETVLVDQDGVRITATELTYTDYGPVLHLLLENQTDGELKFCSGTLGYSCNSINGMILPDLYLNCTVAPGRKAVETVEGSYRMLEALGIRSIGQLEMGFYAVDEDYEETYYPLREIRTTGTDCTCAYRETIADKASEKAYGYEVLSCSEAPSYDQDGVAVRSQVLLRNVDGDLNLLLEVENQSSEMRYLTFENIYVNDLQIQGRSPWAGQDLSPSRRAVVAIALHDILDASFWKSYGLTEVGTVDVEIRQYDMDENIVSQPASFRTVCGDAGAPDRSGTVLLEQDGLRLIGKEILPPDGLNDYQMLLLLDNTSAQSMEVAVSYDSLAVNGYMVDEFFSTWEVPDGRCAAMVLDVNADKLKELGVSDVSGIEEVAFSLEGPTFGKTAVVWDCRKSQ